MKIHMQDWLAIVKKRARRTRGSDRQKSPAPLGLREFAEQLGLAPATVSLVMNGSSVADTIAPETRKMILAAARKFDYRPNFFARCLRTRRSFTIGVIVPELSEGYNVNVLSGIEDYLLQEGYFYLVASHRFQPDLVDEYTELFLHRSVDGLIAINTSWHRALEIPVATVSCHHSVPGAVRIVLDHDLAAEIGLKYLMDLGHRHIAFIKGQAFVPDSEIRWNAIVAAARRVGLPIYANLVGQIDVNSPSPHLGYRVTQKLLAAGEPFTALFAFNDISAMGAIRALYECGRRVPHDVSVLGFDDIESASYQTCSLSTIRQPLNKMGKIAAESILRRIQSPEAAAQEPGEIVVAPELVERETTSVVHWARTQGEQRTVEHR